MKLIYHTDDDRISRFDESVIKVCRNAHVLVACPYVSIDYMNRIVSMAASWRLVTDVEELLGGSPAHCRQEWTDFLVKNRQKIRDQHGLHAKVMVGNGKALIGSANFTTSGIQHLTEMSVLITESHGVNEVEKWISGLWKSGTNATRSKLDSIVSELPNDVIPKRTGLTAAGIERDALLAPLPPDPKRRMRTAIPSQKELREPIVSAIREYGEDVTTKRLYQIMEEKMNLAPRLLEIMTSDGTEPHWYNEIRQTVRWLKKEGWIDPNSPHGRYRLPR